MAPSRLMVLLCALAPAAPVALAQSRFEWLPPLSGFQQSTATGVSDDGSVVVGQSVSITGSVGTVWRYNAGTGSYVASMMPTYNPQTTQRPPIVTSVSADGAGMTVTSSSSGGTVRYWSESTGYMLIGSHFGTGDHVAMISSGGSTVVGTRDPQGDPFRWTLGNGMTPLGFPAGDWELADVAGVSSNGSMLAGTVYGPGHIQPFRWSASGGFELASFEGITNACFDDGSVLLGYAHDSRFWRPDGSVVLAPFVGGAFGNDAGTIIYGVQGGLLWSATQGILTQQQLFAPGVFPDNYSLRDCSASGLWFVGDGLPAGSNNVWAYVATIPAPPSLVPLVAVTPSLVRRRRRQRRVIVIGAAAPPTAPIRTASEARLRPTRPTASLARLIAVFVTLLTTASSAMAQPFTVEVLPMPFNSYLGHSSQQSMTIGISRDGNIISGNGFQYDDNPGGYPDTFRYNNSVGCQYNRTTGTFSYFPNLPGAGSPTYFQAVSPAGDTGLVTSGLINDYFWVRGQSSYTRPFTGPGEINPSLADGGRGVIGETPVSPYGSFIYRDGTMQSPPPPAGFNEYYATHISADASSFVTDEGLYYNFSSGWIDFNQIAPAGWRSLVGTGISSDGTSVVGYYTTPALTTGDFRWSISEGFSAIQTGLPFGLAFETGNSDLSTLVRGPYVYRSQTGVVDLASLINSSGAMPPGLTLESFSGVADDGRTFSGLARDSLDRQYSVVVSIVPAPGSVALTAMAGLVASRRRRRPRRRNALGLKKGR